MITPQIGLGYIALNKLEVKQATKIFEEVTRRALQYVGTMLFGNLLPFDQTQKEKRGAIQSGRDGKDYKSNHQELSVSKPRMGPKRPNQRKNLSLLDQQSEGERVLTTLEEGGFKMAQQEDKISKIEAILSSDKTNLFRR